MDNQNTNMSFFYNRMSIVLILVLMDNQNTGHRWYAHMGNAVLILVLMDNQNTIKVFTPQTANYRLNPCSNG